MTHTTATNNITADAPNSVPESDGFDFCIPAAMPETTKSRIIAMFLIVLILFIKPPYCTHRNLFMFLKYLFQNTHKTEVITNNAQNKNSNSYKITNKLTYYNTKFF